MHSPLRHLHLRRRAQLKKDPYPHPDSRIHLLDNIVFICGIVGPMLAIPQILRIYLEQNAMGVSPVSWGLFATFDVPWVLYGIVHKEKPIAIAYTLWLIMNTMVFIGALMYS